MAKFLYQVKEKRDPQGKPRVYFTCHPDDFDRCFEKIRDDIFKTQICVLYYTEDMTDPIGEDEMESDLGRMNLFVVPITRKLLTTPNRAMDVDIAYAMAEHIPILPFMMESGLDLLYASPDRFGSLQYLNPYSEDTTEISYEDKLNKHLQSVLVSDEMAKRIRSAFDAYIFLSYRKKDRKYANELMRLIHRNPEFQDIAIWYDEFLVPGESFAENIRKALENSRMFALLVTPNLLEESNFVMVEEYPAASKAGKSILPAEMVQTDHNELAAKFEAIPECVDPQDEETFKERLLQAIQRVAVAENDADPEHNFLIGLAYFDGVDVEVNRKRGVRLITSAAEAGLLEAMEKLRNIYNDGLGVPIDRAEAIKWGERVVERYRSQVGDVDTKTIIAKQLLALIYNNFGNYEKARDLNAELYQAVCETAGADDLASLVSLRHFAESCRNLREYDKAREALERAYALQTSKKGAEDPYTLKLMSDLAHVCVLAGDYEKGQELQKTAYDLQCKVLGELHRDSIETLRRIALNYSTMGTKHHSKNDLNAANELLETVYSQYCKILGETHADTIHVASDLASNRLNMGKFAEARDLFEKVYESQYTLYGGDRDSALTTLHNLTLTHMLSRDYQKAWETGERVYAAYVETVGEEHPHALKMLGMQSAIAGKMGNTQLEGELLERLYALKRKVYGDEHKETLDALKSLSDFFKKTGDTQRARDMKAQRCFALYKSRGAEHEETLSALRDLIALEKIDPSVDTQKVSAYALLTNALGNAVDAASLEQLYLVLAKFLGETHEETIAVLLRAACAYGEIEDHRKSLELLEMLYALRSKALGAENPETITTLGNMAHACEELGERSRAVELRKEEYTRLRAVYGEKHDRVHVSLYLLSAVAREAGDYATAAAFGEALYHSACVNFGEEHAETVRALHLWAKANRGLGKDWEALGLYARACALYRRLEGEKSFGVREVLGEMAETHERLNNHREAAALYGQLHARACDEWGNIAPDTLKLLHRRYLCCLHAGDDAEAAEVREELILRLAGLHNRAYEYGQKGDGKTAIAFNRAVYDLRCEVLGKEDARTLGTLFNLAFQYEKTGDYQNAAQCFEMLYEIRRGLLGEDHEDTLNAHFWLAYSLGEIGEHRRAVEAYEQVYAMRCRVPGEEHENTMITLSNLAYECLEDGELSRAVELYERLYTLRRRVLGEEDPSTVRAKENLEIARGRLEK